MGYESDPISVSSSSSSWLSYKVEFKIISFEFEFVVEMIEILIEAIVDLIA